jgi:hypothetical protein
MEGEDLNNAMLFNSYVFLFIWFLGSCGSKRSLSLVSFVKKKKLSIQGFDPNPQVGRRKW